MKGHPTHARRACGPRTPRRTATAVVALSLLACATLVLVYRLGARAGAQEAEAPGGAVGGNGEQSIETWEFQSLLERRILRVPRPNSWDDRRPSASERALDSRLRTAADADARARVVEQMVQSSYCGFQVVHANSSTLSDDLQRLRLDAPMLLTGVMRPARSWTTEHFISGYDASANVTVITMPEGADALQGPFGERPAQVFSKLCGTSEARKLLSPTNIIDKLIGAGLQATDPVAVGAFAELCFRSVDHPEEDSLNTTDIVDGLTQAGWLRKDQAAIGEFAKLCARGEARNLISTTKLMGWRFSVPNDPWLKPCAEACASIAADVEDAAWEAGIPQMYPIGPWADSTRRLRSWVQHVQGALSAADRRKRLRAFDEYYVRSRNVDSDAYVRDAVGLSGREMRRRWTAPDTSFTSSPVLVIGGHLSGLHANAHQRAMTVAASGYRVWYARRGEMKTKSIESTVPGFQYFTSVANISLAADDRAREDALCTQPPGSMVLLPLMWTHTVVGWAEDEHGRPAPLDQAGGMAVSLSYQ